MFDEATLLDEDAAKLRSRSVLGIVESCQQQAGLLDGGQGIAILCLMELFRTMAEDMEAQVAEAKECSREEVREQSRSTLRMYCPAIPLQTLGTEASSAEAES